MYKYNKCISPFLDSSPGHRGSAPDRSRCGGGVLPCPCYDRPERTEASGNWRGEWKESQVWLNTDSMPDLVEVRALHHGKRSFRFIRHGGVTWIVRRPCYLRWRGCFWHHAGSHGASYPTSATRNCSAEKPFMYKWTWALILWTGHRTDTGSEWTHHSDHLCCVSSGTADDRHRTWSITTHFLINIHLVEKRKEKN